MALYSNSTELLTPIETAEFLSVSKQLLALDRFTSRQAGIPPRFPYTQLTERVVRYRKSDLERIINDSHVG